MVRNKANLIFGEASGIAWRMERGPRKKVAYIIGFHGDD